MTKNVKPMRDASYPAETPRAVHPIMFGVLTAMAMAIFAPCVLVPIWIESEDLRDYERSLGKTVADLEAELAQAKDQADALLADPLVNERMVRRELNHRPPGEQLIRWSPRELSAVRVHVPKHQVTNAPPNNNTLSPKMAAISRWLPNWPWRELFAESPQRPILLMMAGGLLLAAFLLYGQSSTSQISHRIKALR